MDMKSTLKYLLHRLPHLALIVISVFLLFCALPNPPINQLTITNQEKLNYYKAHKDSLWFPSVESISSFNLLCNSYPFFLISILLTFLLSNAAVPSNSTNAASSHVSHPIYVISFAFFAGIIVTFLYIPQQLHSMINTNLSHYNFHENLYDVLLFDKSDYDLSFSTAFKQAQMISTVLFYLLLILIAALVANCYELQLNRLSVSSVKDFFRFITYKVKELAFRGIVYIKPTASYTLINQTLPSKDYSSDLEGSSSAAINQNTIETAQTPPAIDTDVEEELSIASPNSIQIDYPRSRAAAESAPKGATILSPHYTELQSQLDQKSVNLSQLAEQLQQSRAHCDDLEHELASLRSTSQGSMNNSSTNALTAKVEELKGLNQTLLTEKLSLEEAFERLKSEHFRLITAQSKQSSDKNNDLSMLAELTSELISSRAAQVQLRSENAANMEISVKTSELQSYSKGIINEMKDEMSQLREKNNNLLREVRNQAGVQSREAQGAAQEQLVREELERFYSSLKHIYTNLQRHNNQTLSHYNTKLITSTSNLRLIHQRFNLLAVANTRMKEFMTAMKAKYHELKYDNSELESALREKDSIIAELADEIVELKAILSKLSNKSENEIEVSNSENNEEISSNVTKDEITSTTQSPTATQSIHDFQSQLQQLQCELEQKDLLLDKKTQQFSSQLLSVNNELSALKLQNAQNEAQFSSQLAENNELKQQMLSLEMKQNKAKEMIMKLRDRAEEEKNGKEESRNKLLAAQQEIEKNNSIHNNTIIQFTEQIGDKNDEISRLQAKIEQFNHEINWKQERIDALQEIIHNSKDSKNSKNDEEVNMNNEKNDNCVQLPQQFSTLLPSNQHLINSLQSKFNLSTQEEITEFIEELAANPIILAHLKPAEQQEARDEKANDNDLLGEVDSINPLHQQCNSLQQQLAQLSLELLSKNEEVLQLKTAIELLNQSKNDEEEEDFDTKLEEIKQLKHEINDLTNSFQLANETLQIKQNKAKDIINKLKQIITLEKEANQGLKESNEQLIAENKNYQILVQQLNEQSNQSTIHSIKAMNDEDHIDDTINRGNNLTNNAPPNHNLIAMEQVEMEFNSLKTELIMSKEALNNQQQQLHSKDKQIEQLNDDHAAIIVSLEQKGNEMKAEINNLTTHHNEKQIKAEELIKELREIIAQQSANQSKSKEHNLPEELATGGRALSEGYERRAAEELEGKQQLIDSMAHQILLFKQSNNAANSNESFLTQLAEIDQNLAQQFNSLAGQFHSTFQQLNFKFQSFQTLQERRMRQLVALLASKSDQIKQLNSDLCALQLNHPRAEATQELSLKHEISSVSNDSVDISSNLQSRLFGLLRAYENIIREEKIELDNNSAYSLSHENKLSHHSTNNENLFLTPAKPLSATDLSGSAGAGEDNLSKGIARLLQLNSLLTEKLQKPWEQGAISGNNSEIISKAHKQIQQLAKFNVLAGHNSTQ
jgi:hypothetical protein